MPPKLRIKLSTKVSALKRNLSSSFSSTRNAILRSGSSSIESYSLTAKCSRIDKMVLSWRYSSKCTEHTSKKTQIVWTHSVNNRHSTLLIKSTAVVFMKRLLDLILLSEKIKIRIEINTMNHRTTILMSYWKIWNMWEDLLKKMVKYHRRRSRNISLKNWLKSSSRWRIVAVSKKRRRFSDGP